MMEIDRDLSQIAAKTVRGRPKSAWRTACQVLCSLAALEEGFYVEGWAVTLDNQLVIEHAWLELDGRIVDPTRWQDDLAYFPVLRFEKAQMLEALTDCPRLPINWRGGARLRDNPAYYRAWQNARALAQIQLAHAERAA